MASVQSRGIHHRSRLTTGLALGGALLLGVSSGKAGATPTCTFGTISSCNTTIGNLTFTNFTLTDAGTPNGIDNDDEITISQLSPTSYAINSSFVRNPSTYLASPSGQYSFRVTTTSPRDLNQAALNSITVPEGNFTYTYALTPSIGSAFSLISAGTPAGPTSFESTTLSTDVVITWSNSTGLSTGATFFLSLDNDTPPPFGVPGPLPLFGAAAAFGVSRRLRQRIASTC